MKSKVTLIIFLLLIIILFVAMFWGIEIGNFQILSVAQLKNKNEELNDTIKQAAELTSIEYPKEIDTLEETYEEYIVQKQKYEEISGFNSESKSEIYENKQYDIVYLWETVGKYATEHNLTIGMDVKKTSGENLYNLNFTVSGQYVNISEFIHDIENNSDLFFRIYNFKMSGDSEEVSSTFTVKNVSIDPETLITSATQNSDSEQLPEDTTNQNVVTE